VAAGGSQFYNVELDTSTPMWAYGSIQDIGSRRGQIQIPEPRVLRPGAPFIPAAAWEAAPGGEGSNHAVDPTNPNIVYSHGFYGDFTRTDLGATAAGGRGRGSATPIRPADPTAELRAQWMAPFIISPHDNTIVYAGFQTLFRSKNRGDAWETISHDLSDNNSAQMGQNPVGDSLPDDHCGG
jgi:hypothetical protein